MPEGVAQAGGVGPIEHFCRRLDLFCASFERASQHCFIVVHKEVKTRASAPKIFRLAVEFVVWITDHDDRAVDRDFCMEDLSVRVGDPE